MTKSKKVFTAVFFLFVSMLLPSLNFAQTEKRNSNSEGTIEIDGILFRYVRQGEGEPVLVLGSSVYYPKSVC